MATFDEHILQAKRNLSFLTGIDNTVKDCYDWLVTVCFYTALHVVNAHLSRFKLQYRKHSDVNHAINFATYSPAKLPQDIYIFYMALQSLSRRSRYLVSEKGDNLKEPKAFLLFEKQLAKSLRHLERMISHFCPLYDIDIKSRLLVCRKISNTKEFKHLSINKVGKAFPTYH